jgi:drug/metabolite transporter (DMT)-like permease
MKSRFAAAYPLLFVVLWSTGFIGARLGLPHAPPLLFLLVRYAVVIAIMGSVAIVMRAPWPRGLAAWAHIGLAGLLIHGVYLGGVFVAISRGLPAGVASLVVGLQPLLTALIAGAWLGEPVTSRQWSGLLLGFVGVGLVVSAKFGSTFGFAALWPALAALAGITLGTLYQKRYCPRFDWRAGVVAQFVPAALATALVSALVEPWHIAWTGDFVFALAWLVLVLSIGAITLLNHLIHTGDAVDVASLFYLVPPCTALLAWGLFGEKFGGVALAGMALAVWGVSRARR